MISLADAPAPLALPQAIVTIIGTVITALAVLVGAAWAYFKFVNGRTLKSRLNVNTQAQWVQNEGLLRVRVTITNVGVGKVSIVHQGTVLEVSKLAFPITTPGDLATWERLRVIRIFKDSEWLEPAEFITDEVLIKGPASGPQVLEIKTWIVCRSFNKTTNVSDRIICPPDAVINPN